MKLLIEKVRSKQLSEVITPNPVNKVEMDNLIDEICNKLPSNIPEWLLQKEVTAIGGPNSMFYLASFILSLLENSSTNSSSNNTNSNNSCKNEIQIIN